MTQMLISMSGHLNSRYLITHRNFFRKQTTKQKKKKKMLFLPVKRSAGCQGLRAKNTLFEAEWRKGRFFPKQPEGLDLDGQAERAKFAAFFEF